MQVPVLVTFTTHYAQMEDRIRLVGRDSVGGAQTLWLTRRMMDLLVEKLVGCLAQHSGQLSGDQGHQNVVQEFEQEAAEAAFTPTQNVEANPDAPSWLVTTVDIKTSDKGAVVIFKSDGTAHSAGIAFNHRHLRQWLAIVLVAYRTGSWPLAVWPMWMSVDQTSTMERPSSLH